MKPTICIYCKTVSRWSPIYLWTQQITKVQSHLQTDTVPLKKHHTLFVVNSKEKLQVESKMVGVAFIWKQQNAMTEP